MNTPRSLDYLDARVCGKNDGSTELKHCASRIGMAERARRRTRSNRLV